MSAVAPEPDPQEPDQQEPDPKESEPQGQLEPEQPSHSRPSQSQPSQSRPSQSQPSQPSQSQPQSDRGEPPRFTWVPGSGKGGQELSGPVPPEALPGGQEADDTDGLDWQALLDALAASGILGGDPGNQDAELAEELEAEREGRMGSPLEPAQLAALAVEHMEPGTALAGWLAVAAGAAASLDENGLTGLAIAARKQASYAHGVELTAVAQITSRAAAADRRVGVSTEGRPARVCRDAVGQVEMALRLTHDGAQSRADLALTLTWRLPRTLAALAVGWIDLDRAEIIARATSVLSEHAARAVEAEVLPGARRMTYPELRDRLHHLVLAADPDGAEERRQKAERNANVRLYADEDQTATLVADKLPQIESASGFARINALARARKAAGLPGSLGVHRAQVLLGLILGTMPPTPPAEDAPPDQPPASDPSPGGGPSADDHPGTPGGPNPDDRSSSRGGSSSDGRSGPRGGRGGSSSDGHIGPRGGPSPDDRSGPRGGSSSGGHTGPHGGPKPDGQRRSSLNGRSGTHNRPGSDKPVFPPDHPDLPLDDVPLPPGELPPPPEDQLPPPPGELPPPEDQLPPPPGELPPPEDQLPPPDEPPAADGVDAADGADDGADQGEAFDPWEEDDDPYGTGPAPVWPALGVLPPGLAQPAPAGNPPAAGLLDVTVPWTTLAGLASLPGTLGRIGAITPAQARQLALAAATDPAVQWRVIVTSSDGHAITVARIHRARRARDPSGSRPGDGPPGRGPAGRVTLTISQDTIAAHANGGPGPPGRETGPPEPGTGPAGRETDPPGLGTGPPSRRAELPWRGNELPGGSGSASRILAAALRTADRALRRALMQAEADDAAGGCAHTAASAAYRPPPRLREYVIARDLTCRNPTCRQPAWRADLDHTIAWENGGLTCYCNLGGACRRDHQLKQHPRWKLAQRRPGWFEWIAPSGRTYISEPATYIA